MATTPRLDDGISKSTTKSVTQQLLARAHSPDSAERIYADKIQYRPLLLRPNSPPPSAAPDDARASRRRARHQRARALKPRPLSSRQRRALNLHEAVPAPAPNDGDGNKEKGTKGENKKGKISYAVLEPLNRMWQGYAREILGGELYASSVASVGAQGAAAKLSAAEFAGARVRVSRSSCPGRVGIEGIVVRDTRFTFEIATASGAVKTVPKEGTMFRVDLPARAKQRAQIAAVANDAGGGSGDDGRGGSSDTFSFEIHGSQFQHRSADRANKKFKAHYLDKL